ncbi:MAG: hypothetical protein O3A19_02885 [Planctomycetota bacterium]|nr:hypothetical protein [Planctomycetota bacterium]
MIRRPLRDLLLSTALVTSGFSASAIAAETITIADIAPVGTFFIMGADATETMCDRFNGNPLGGLWKTEAVQKTLGKAFENARDNMMKELAASGMDLETMSWPANLGVAFYSDLDEETGQSKVFMLGYGDWEANAKDADRMMASLLDAWKKDDGIDVDSKEIRGREVMVLTQVGEPDQGDPADEFGQMDDMMMMLGDPSEMAPDFSTMYMVQDGPRFIMANDLLAVDDALAIFDGDDAKVIASTDDWTKTLKQLDGAEAYAVLLTDPLQDLLAPIFMGPAGMVKPMIGELFGDIRGYGFGLSMPEDPSTASMVLTASILAPDDKSGIMGLLLEQDKVGQAPPKVIDAHAIGYGRMNFNFRGLMPLVSKMSAAMPMGGDEVDGMVDQFGPMVTPALESLGPAIHVLTTASGTTVIIPTNDSQKVQPLLAMLGPGMNLQPRDFLGETMWTGEGMGACVAGNWLVIGNDKGTEQVIRGLNAGAVDHPITDLQIFTDSVNRMPGGDAVGWGYVNVVEQFASSREMAEQMIGMLNAQGEFGPEDANGADKMTEAVVDLMTELKPEELARFVGPTVWKFSSDDLGWVYRQWFLPPVNVGG